MKTLIVVLALAIAGPVAAQPAPRGAPAPAAQEPRREKIKKRIRALRAYTLTEELQLDEQTAGRLFPVLAKFDDELDKLLVQRADLQRRLEGSAQISDPKQLDKLIDDATANQRAMWETEEKRLAQLRKILTPAQTARLLVVLPAMERKIQHQLRRAMRKAAVRGAPVDDDDDGGDLGVNPFGPPAAKGRPAPRQPACDPFTDARGCGARK